MYLCLFCLQYEQYYAGAAAAAGAPQYLYTTTGGSPSNTSNGGGGGNGNSSGSNGNNGTGATSPPTGPPPPLPPQHPTHFYAPAAPPPHHHPPVPAGPPPPPAQVDHLYYPFATGPHPALPPPPHAPMGLTEQQLLLYATDATSCQQTSTSDSQTAPQEVNSSFSMYITGFFFGLHVFSHLAFSNCIRDGSDESLWRRFQISTKVISLLQLFTIDRTIVYMLVIAINGHYKCRRYVCY